MIPIILSNDIYAPWWTMHDGQGNYTGIHGRLTGTTKARVKEMLNGEYVASLTVPYSALHASALTKGGLIVLRTNFNKDLQVFRIDRIGKTMRDGMVSLSLNHISYDLNKAICKPFAATDRNGLTTVLADQIVTTPFMFNSSLTSSTNTVASDVPRTVRDVIGGMDDNILQTFKAEVEWDNAQVFIMNKRGGDQGVIIQDRKNLLDYSQEDSVTDTYDYIVGYWKGENAVVYSDPNYVVDGVAQGERGLVVDMTSVWRDTQPEKWMINNRCRWYITIEHPEQFRPSVSIKVDFQSLRQFKQYEMVSALESVQLGDTVRVINSMMDIDITARVIQTEWDVLADEYASVIIGDFRPTLATTISGLIKAVK